MNLIKESLLKDFSCYEADHDRKLLTLRKDRKKVTHIERMNAVIEIPFDPFPFVSVLILLLINV